MKSWLMFSCLYANCATLNGGCQEVKIAIFEDENVRTFFIPENSIKKIHISPFGNFHFAICSYPSWACYLRNIFTRVGQSSWINKKIPFLFTFYLYLCLKIPLSLCVLTIIILSLRSGQFPTILRMLSFMRLQKKTFKTTKQNNLTFSSQAFQNLMTNIILVQNNKVITS